MSDEFKRSFPPVIAPGARVLILGSLPGEESLRQSQYYAHCRNAFWPIMGELFGFDPKLPYPERLEELKRNRIALWDTIGAGRRQGSLDARIRDAVSNPVPGLLKEYPTIALVACNGTKSFDQLRRSAPELFSGNRLAIRQFPSTSPAAAMFRFEEKLRAYRKIRDFLENPALFSGNDPV